MTKFAVQTYDDEATGAYNDDEDNELETEREIDESSNTEQEFEPGDDFRQTSPEQVFVVKDQKTIWSLVKLLIH